MTPSTTPTFKDPRFESAVAEVFAADAAFDAPRFAARLHEDGTFQLGGNPPVTGREAIRASVGEFFASGLLREMSHRLQQVWEHEDTLIYRAEVRYVLADGRALELPYMNVLRFRGEQIEDYRVFVDLAPLHSAAASMGGPPSTESAPAAEPEHAATRDGEDRALPVVVSFEVTPEQQRALADDIYAFNMEVVRHQPGFVSTNLYLSADGSRVINFGQWRDRDAYERFLSGSLPQTAPESFSRFPFDSRPYALAFRVTKPPAARP